MLDTKPSKELSNKDFEVLNVEQIANIKILLIKSSHINE